MTAAAVLGLPDRPNRQVLLAVELVDPFARTRVTRGVGVVAVGLKNPPIVNASGRFVWLVEEQAWPARILVTPTDGRYAAAIAAAPPRPADLARARAEERLLRIQLRPARGYQPDQGITGIRGCLRATAAPNARPIAGARVQLAWSDPNGDWLPPKPLPENAGADDPGAPSPPEAQTDADGEFLALLRRVPPEALNVDNGRMTVRLQFTRGRVLPETRATPAYSIPEGGIPATALALSWADLDPI